MYWLLKTEPETYSYADLVTRGKDMWEGVRNFQAAKFLKSMQPGDLAFIYHSGKQRAIVGIAEICSHPYPDPTASDTRWVTVDIRPKEELARPVTLKEIKSEPTFANWELVRLSRLSVMPVPPRVWTSILELSRKTGLT